MEAAEDKSLQEEADVPIQPHTESDGATEDAKGPEVCKFYLLGRCHFGDRCRLTHSASALTVSKDEQTEEKGSRNQNTSRNLDKPEKSKDEKNDDSKKKPRMRTADDVISRILWDSSVDPADFIVGHIDRFLGVLERPFSEFSWDTQVCDCDYSEEMAIPRHRIQYFRYKGQRVWDRDSRTDHVFGSTGQTVMPPFDRDAKRQENIGPDSKQEVDQSPVEKTEKDNSLEHSLGGAVQEGTLTNTADTLNSNTNRSVVKECGASGLVPETEGLSISPHTEIQEEWKDSLDKDEEEEVAKEPVKSIPKEPRPGRKPHKPTHFVCFRVDSPAALQAYQRVQRKVITHLPQSERFWQKPESLHVTLCLLILESPAEVFAASEVLRAVVKKLYKPPISVSFAPKLKHFNGRVLYLPPRPLPDIQNLNAPLQDAFREKGWLHRHSRHPIYHLTLAKANEEGAERMFEDVGLIRLPKDINFGKLNVDKLYLCLINEPKTVTGFYQTVCVVHLPTV